MKPFGGRPTLQAQLILMLSLISVMGLVAVGVVASRTIEDQFKRTIGRNALNIARTFSENPEVFKNVGAKNGAAHIQPVAEAVRKQTGVKSVIVTDLEGKVYSHPITYRLGSTEKQPDAEPVTGLPGVSAFSGRLGPSFRAETPLYRNGEKVGTVAVDVLVNQIRSSLMSFYGKLFLALVAGLAVSVAGAAMLARGIKSIIYGMEPGEIALLLRQREGILESIREGIVAVDAEAGITLINGAARRLFGISGNVRGQSVGAAIPGTDLPAVLQSGEAEFDSEITVRGRRVMAQLIPLLSDDKTMGAIGSFRDLTEVRAMAEQITGVTMYVEALRTQNHEFQNKLQTISGLVQLGCYDRVVEFISEVSDERRSAISFITRRIRNPAVGGILLGKLARCRELGAVFEVDPSSWCGPLDAIDSQSLVVIIGNLVENAIESVSSMPRDRRRICFGMFDESGRVLISVRDSGNGMEEEIVKKIFDRGFTTKEGSQPRGYGLYNLRKAVEALGGDIEVDTVAGKYAEFIISLPVGRESDGD